MADVDVSVDAAVGVSLAYHDLNFTVQLSRTRKGEPATKAILTRVTGVCGAGRVHAIMGPSGAGKTSMLDILAGRAIASGGRLWLSARGGLAPAGYAQAVRKLCAYVQQDDAIMASMTVREAIAMAATLTLPSEPGAGDDAAARTARLLRTFQLEECAGTLVGDPNNPRMKGISGGERKRTAVAMCAVSEPPVLFLDEPTSGLDAHKAYALVRSLSRLAHGAPRRCTVVCTCHQPSSDIFALFDDLTLLLAGRAVYAGGARASVAHFGAAGFACPTYANPADFFFMHVLTDADAAGFDDAARAAQLGEFWAASEPRAQNDAAAAEMVARPAVDARDAAAPRARAAWRVQFGVLLRRAVNEVKRNPMAGKAVVAQAVIFGVIIALIWFDVADDQNGVQDRSGALFFMTANMMMQNVMGTLTMFGNQRAAVLREQENGMYHTLPYFLAKVMCDVPLKVVAPSLFGSIAYWTVGFQPSAHKFALAIATLVLLAHAGTAIGLFLACLFPEIAVALAVAPLVILPLMMFSGFFLNPESTPIFLKWVEWLSPMKYAFSAMARLEFAGLELACASDQMRAVVESGSGELVSVCPYSSGDEYLETLNIQPFLTVSRCMLLLTALAVVFISLAYAGLVRISSQVRAKAVPPAMPAPPGRTLATDEPKPAPEPTPASLEFEDTKTAASLGV